MNTFNQNRFSFQSANTAKQNFSFVEVHQNIHFQQTQGFVNPFTLKRVWGRGQGVKGLMRIFNR